MLRRDSLLPALWNPRTADSRFRETADAQRERPRRRNERDRHGGSGRRCAGLICGYGEIGKHAGLRSQCFGLRVRAPLPAPETPPRLSQARGCGLYGPGEKNRVRERGGARCVLMCAAGGRNRNAGRRCKIRKTGEENNEQPAHCERNVFCGPLLFGRRSVWNCIGENDACHCVCCRGALSSRCGQGV